MFKALTAAALLVFAAGCAPVSAPPSGAGPNEQEPIIRGDVQDGARQCVASEWQSWVGKPRSSLPATAEGLVFRVLCKDCMATMDYRSNRVTFTYDDGGVINRVTCG